MLHQSLLIFSFLLVFFGVLYFVLIASYCYGWIKTKSITVSGAHTIFVSVIISARNEEKNIAKCIQAILKQTYSENYFEIIVVDDASEDATNSLVQPFCKKNKNVKLITLSNEKNNLGKKHAIAEAIKIAQGELIVTTDADCEMNGNWLSTIVSWYEQTHAKMIVAPVVFHQEKTLFEKMQSLEFISLIASAGASLYFKKAIMCNGANLAYTKKAFEEVNGFENIDNTASGDDVLLMYKIKNKYSDGIIFLKNVDALIFTKAKQTITEFFNQRKRWTSKKFFDLNFETKKVSLIVYLFNFLLFSFFVLLPFCYSKIVVHLSFYELGLIVFSIKCFIDFLLLVLATSFFKKKHLLLFFLPEQFLYILYVVVVGLLGIKGNYEWKNRKYKN